MRGPLYAVHPLCCLGMAEKERIIPGSVAWAAMCHADTCKRAHVSMQAMREEGWVLVEDEVRHEQQGIVLIFGGPVSGRALSGLKSYTSALVAVCGDCDAWL